MHCEHTADAAATDTELRLCVNCHNEQAAPSEDPNWCADCWSGWLWYLRWIGRST